MARRSFVHHLRVPIRRQSPRRLFGPAQSILETSHLHFGQHLVQISIQHAEPIDEHVLKVILGLVQAVQVDSVSVGKVKIVEESLGVQNLVQTFNLVS